MTEGPWHAIIHKVTNSQKQLSDWRTNGCVTTWTQLMPLICSLLNGLNGRFYVMHMTIIVLKVQLQSCIYQRKLGVKSWTTYSLLSSQHCKPKSVLQRLFLKLVKSQLGEDICHMHLSKREREEEESQKISEKRGQRIIKLWEGTGRGEGSIFTFLYP